MKVIVSTDSIKYPLTGVGRYTFELIQALQKLNALDEMLFLKKMTIRNEILFSEGKHKGNEMGGFFSFLKRNKLLIDAVSTIFPLMQGIALRNNRDYIYHSTAYYLPAFHERSIATFHDISNFTCPQYHPDERIRYMSKRLASSMERASCIITVSEFTKSELVRFCNYPESKIHVTPLACGDEFHPRTMDDVAPLLRRLGLSWNKFTLYIGSIEPRKNIGALLDAYEKLPLLIRRNYPLVLCGFKGWKSQDLHERFSKAEQQGWLKYLGFVEQENLPLLYSAARIFVFPSHYEGFGLPVLEAMASGIPVVCSNAASLPEITGDAALQSEPDDIDLLSLNIHKALVDEAWRAIAITRGFLRAERFSWSRCAKETISVYNIV
ncbi:glycosyltransferase family 4 protein [Dickeya zeae]|uniref:glycosyltransferase family 4 protein n=1 Tax=Dickeya zeae TaxID=204042 RepID=UPI000C9D09B3|nr:glycosyltransferase family 1 protein [Dickeya zeae]AUQ24167.1 glycosyltransferase family 1 protein [Dickeya zeae]UJR57281.1 glycosyltransferase family 4 protein [Dickeya zeae]